MKSAFRVRMSAQDGRVALHVVLLMTTPSSPSWVRMQGFCLPLFFRVLKAFCHKRIPARNELHLSGNV